MNRLLLVSILAATTLLVVGCASDDQDQGSAAAQKVDRMPEVLLLTREGCANTAPLLANLKAAAEAFDPPLVFRVLDQGELVDSDPRAGYATPTILVNNRDLLGAEQPKPPFPPPS